MNDEFRTISLQPSCVNLRHKLMFVDERQATPGQVSADSDTRVYFCTMSGDSLGPDDDPVSPTDCTCDRACYKRGPFESA